MKTPTEIQEYMQLEGWHVTVVSPAEQEITPNRREEAAYDPAFSNIYVFDAQSYFTIAPEDGDIIYYFDGSDFDETEEFLYALEEAFAAADFPSEKEKMHAVLRQLEKQHPYDQ